MCWTRCLCLYGVETMNPLAQVMSPKHKTSWEDTNTIYSKSVSLSGSAEVQYPKSIVSEVFLLFRFSVIYTGTVIFSIMFMIQQRIFEGPMYLGAFPLSAAHLEFQGLILMAWKTLRRHVVPMDTPLDTCEQRKQLCNQSHWENISTQKLPWSPGFFSREWPRSWLKSSAWESNLWTLTCIPLSQEMKYNDRRARSSPELQQLSGIGRSQQIPHPLRPFCHSPGLSVHFHKERTLHENISCGLIVRGK